MKNILITGGSSGIGLNLIKTLISQKSFKIIYTYNKNEVIINQNNCQCFKVDLTNKDEFNSFLFFLSELDVDILINNYHTGFIPMHSHKVDDKILLDGFTKNIIPTINLTNFFISKFRKKNQVKSSLSYLIH